MTRTPLYCSNNCFVYKAKKGYEVWKFDGIKETRIFISGSDGDRWLERARIEADKRCDKVKSGEYMLGLSKPRGT